MVCILGYYLISHVAKIVIQAHTVQGRTSAFHSFDSRHSGHYRQTSPGSQQGMFDDERYSIIPPSAIHQFEPAFPIQY